MKMDDERDQINGQGDAEQIETNVNETPRQQDAAVETVEEPKSQKKTADKHTHKLEAALEAAEKERDDFKDKYLRTFSDFNNYKKRSMTAAAAANCDGQAEVIARILPVIDNFERALEPIGDSCEDAFVKGMFMVYRQLSDAISALGCKEISAQGEAFDPNFHQAISVDEAGEGQQPGVVTAVLQKGYTLGDKVLRHSMVTVSK
jgi:molecular chaperone GrpE